MVLFYLLLVAYSYQWYTTTFYWLTAYSYDTLPPSSGPLPIPTVLCYILLITCLYQCYTTIPMVLYYLVMTYCLYLLSSTIICWPTAYRYGTLLPSTGQCLSLWYTTTLYWLLSIPVMLFYILLALPLILYYLLWYFTTFYWLNAYPYVPPIPLVRYYLLIAPCLSLWYSTVIYWLYAYTYDTLLPSTGPLSIPMVPYHLLLAP